MNTRQQCEKFYFNGKNWWKLHATEQKRYFSLIEFLKIIIFQIIHNFHPNNPSIKHFCCEVKSKQYNIHSRAFISGSFLFSVVWQHMWKSHTQQLGIYRRRPAECVLVVVGLCFLFVFVWLRDSFFHEKLIGAGFGTTMLVFFPRSQPIPTKCAGPNSFL